MADINFDGIPQAMKDCPQWVLWKFETRKGKITKAPCKPNGRHASSTDPTTWNDFSKIKGAYELGKNLPANDDIHFDGIGFVFTRESGFSGVDLDHCHDKSTGETDEWAKKYLSQLDSYSELSPSGEGWHAIIKGSIPLGCTGGKKGLSGDGYRPDAAIEIYSEGRFFTVTGNRLEGCPETVEEREKTLREIYRSVFGECKAKPETARLKKQPSTPNSQQQTDDQIIRLASEAANSKKFIALMDGDISGYPSHSEADQALCNILAFYTTSKEQIDSIFRRSGLYREKWDRDDYRTGTIEKAIADTVKAYEPMHPRETPAEPEVKSFGGYTFKLLIDIINDKRKKALEHPKVLAALAEMRKTDPNLFDIFCISLEKKTKFHASTVISCLNAHIAMGGTAPENVVPCDIKELIGTFKKWLYIAEDYNITGPFAGIIANFCEGSPDIIGIIGPSGSTKTEFIRALGETQNQYVYPISTITEHTLVSGHKDSNDLVPLLNGRILTIKDLTSILARKEDVRAAIFADFRELTDEYIRKEFGNGIAKEYHDIHSSILFASTNAIERYYSMYSNLGQRMIFIRPRNDPKEARKRAAENRGKQKEMRAELREVTMRFIASMIQAKDERGLPITSEEVQEEMGILYDFLALARTTIHHDFKTGEMDELPEPEFPTRIANTVGRLMEVHALFYGRDEVNAEDVAFGCRILTDNIPTTRWRILNALTKDWQHTSKISQLADLPTRSVKYHLDELVALKLAEKLLKDEVEDSMDRRFDYFKLSDSASEAIEIYDTRIRIKGTIEEEQSKRLDKQNILLPNPCVISPPVEGEGETSENSREEPTLGKIDRPTPSTVPDCGSCQAALTGDKSLITCPDCGFFGEAQQ